MASYDSASFSTDAFSEDAFDFGGAATQGGYRSLVARWMGGLLAAPASPSPSITQGGGWIDERNSKRYREQLERLAKIADERLYPKKAAEIVEELSELPVEIPELMKMTQGPQLTGTLSLTPPLDYSLIEKEINKLRIYLDRMSNERLKMLRILEADDEAAFLLMLQ